MKVCKRHEGAVIVYSSSFCPLCNSCEILKAADQKMKSAIGMVSTVQRALEKDIEEYFISTLDLAGDFIRKAREEVSRLMEISSGDSDLEEEVRRLVEEIKQNSEATRAPR